MAQKEKKATTVEKQSTLLMSSVPAPPIFFAYLLRSDLGEEETPLIIRLVEKCCTFEKVTKKQQTEGPHFGSWDRRPSWFSFAMRVGPFCPIFLVIFREFVKTWEKGDRRGEGSRYSSHLCTVPCTNHQGNACPSLAQGLGKTVPSVSFLVVYFAHILLLGEEHPPAWFSVSNFWPDLLPQRLALSCVAP